MSNTLVLINTLFSTGFDTDLCFSSTAGIEILAVRNGDLEKHQFDTPSQNEMKGEACLETSTSTEEPNYIEGWSRVLLMSALMGAVFMVALDNSILCEFAAHRDFVHLKSLIINSISNGNSTNYVRLQ